MAIMCVAEHFNQDCSLSAVLRTHNRFSNILRSKLMMGTNIAQEKHFIQSSNLLSPIIDLSNVLVRVESKPLSACLPFFGDASLKR